ncbi:protein XRI1 isoform X2 [Impatiens glandulifera]|uniref:protein XRI1 isoform X2 n=1 Tax=Impatiens glandulifera TaxID=253017 RepID=UPI001FB0C945|nr:protein XRI1 isoform X2 [Impatiens glandulifera]
MDYGNHSQMWGWQGEDFDIQKESNLDISHCAWNEVNQGKDCFSYMQEDDESTPVRACADLAYHVAAAADIGNVNKNLEETREMMNSSQSKRRRMLQFDNEFVGKSSLCSETPSTFLKSKDREDLLGDALTEWVSVFAEEEDISMSGSDGLDQTSEGWLADCLNDPDIHSTSEMMNLSDPSNDVHIEVTEMSQTPPPEYEATVVQKHHKEVRPNVIFKGRKSYIRTPMKMASSVVYPFAFVKPCGAHGDVTLKDINQRIQTPPPEKSIQGKDDPSSSYPTSAFSGKPVVGKTKIRTEGGKGSITIMRTKG